MYSVRAEVLVEGTVVDSLRTAVGFRATTFSGAAGVPPFTLNGEPLHFRGFSHHNSIGGLGVAIPERVQLFRVQASRAMGSNMWRSPGPPGAFRRP
jgi:beta-galactosidase/beta-glucuronidase